MAATSRLMDVIMWEELGGVPGRIRYIADDASRKRRAVDDKHIGYKLAHINSYTGHTVSHSRFYIGHKLSHDTLYIGHKLCHTPLYKSHKLRHTHLYKGV